LRLGLTFPACTGLKQEIPCGTPLPPIYFSASPLAGFCSLVISADSLTYCLLKLMSQLLSHQNLKEQLSSSVFLNSGSKIYSVRLLLFWSAASSDMISFCNPWLSDFAFYSRIFRLSFLPTSRDSGTKCLSGPSAHFPEDTASVSDNPGPKPVIF
jgi:hypothetical protein